MKQASAWLACAAVALSPAFAQSGTIPAGPAPQPSNLPAGSAPQPQPQPQPHPGGPGIATPKPITDGTSPFPDGSSTVPQQTAPRLANGKRPTYSGTRALMGPCMFRETSGESAIPATLITFGIEKALNLVGAALKKAGEDEVKTFYANGNFEGKPAALKEQCVLVLRGQFAGAIDEKDIADLESAPPAWANNMLLPGSALVTLARRHRVYMTAQPDFMFEAAFRSSSDGTAFTLRPLYAALNKPVARPALNFSGDSRHVAIIISLVAPDAEFDADSNPGAEIVLGQLSPKTPVRFQFPKVGDNADYVGWPQESRWFPLKAEDVNGPFTVRVAVTETRTGSALAKFLSEMFEEVKPALQTEAENRLIAAKGREAKVAEMQAEATLEASYQAAVNTALTSLNQCASSTADGTSFEDQSARLALSQKANTDQDAANQAAISAAKKEIPFSGDTMVAPSAGAAVIADCKSKRDAAFKKLGGTGVS